MKRIILLVSVLGVFLTSCERAEVESVTKNDLDKVNTDAQAKLDFPTNIIAVDWSQQSSNQFYFWSNKGKARFGTFIDTDPSGTSEYSFTTASGKTPSDIAEISIATEPGTSVNRCYTYYFDGTMSEGYSNILDAYTSPVPYVCATGKYPSNIVGIAVSTLGYTYAWYNDGTVSYGTKTNLASIHAPYDYSVPAGKTYSNIIGMAIDRSDSNKIYTWYSDGTVSIGTSDNLSYYAAPVAFD